MTKLGKWIAGVVAVILIGLAAWAFWPKGEGSATGTLRVGFVGPISGTSDVVGLPILHGAQLAMQELRAQGMQVELVVANDDCDAAQAKVAMQRLIEVERVRFVIGGICNDEAMALKEVAEQERVLLMVPLVPGVAVTNGTRYVFRTTQADSMGGKQLGERAAQQYKFAFVVSETQEDQAAYRNAFINAFVAGHGAVVNNEEYIPGVSDIKRQVTRMKTVKPAADVLFLNFKSGAVAKMYLDEMAKQGVKLPVYGSPVVAGLAEQAAYQARLNGMVFAEAPDLDSKRAQAVAFTAAYEKAFGGMDGVPAYNAAAYEAFHLISEAWKSGAGTPDAVRSYLLGLKSYEGVQGTYRFALNGDMEGVAFNLKKVVNGKRETLQ